MYTIKNVMSVLFLVAIVFTLSGCGGGGGNNGTVKGFYIPEFCGDKIIQTGESCDDGNLQSGDGCSATCRLETNLISAGYSHTCAITAAGGVKCWGDNRFGQLGDRTNKDSSEPVDVSGLKTGVAAISAGANHTCAVTTSDGVKCWGQNFTGQLGDGTTNKRSTPVDVLGLSNGVPAISAGYRHTCAVTTSGGVKCWGDNQYGQLGDGTTTRSYTPVDVSGLKTGVAAISAGYSHTCAITTANGAKCWGDNSISQLGDGTTTRSYTPVDVSELTSGITAISASSHTCAVTAAGGVKCWGINQFGQLGDGTTTRSYTPVDVSGLSSRVSSISVGSTHNCALTTAGGIKCWGDNQYGKLGDGTTTDRYTPVDVSGLSSGVVAMSAGLLHTCALTTANAIKCWGDNQYGKLGDGTTTDSLTPVDVVGF